MSAGADAAVVSTHKLISGITQTSVLMARAERINLARLDSMVAMTQSTSPQVLMYASIDAARQQMATRGAEPGRGVVRPHTAHDLELRPRPQRLRARDGAARRLPHCRRSGRPAQRRAQRDLRRLARRPREAGGRVSRLRGHQLLEVGV